MNRGAFLPLLASGLVRIPKALGEMGYAPGRDLVVDVRYADGRLDRLPDLAREPGTPG